MKGLFTLLIYFLVFTGADAQGSWELVYENDAQGNTIFGKLDDLVQAIRAGKSIRVHFIMGKEDTSETYVEHTALVKFTTVMNSPRGQFVTGQIDPIVGQVPDFVNQQVKLKENLEWSLIVSTTGKNDQMTRNVVTGEVVSHSVRNWGVKWFEEKP